MRLEMVIRIQNEILDGESWGFFSNEPYKKKPVMTIEHFVLYSDDHLESRLRNWRLPGLGQITWWIVMTKIMRGHSRKQILQKSRNSCRVNGQGCGCIGKVHSRCNFLQSWTKYKLSKNIFAVTNFALIIGRDWAQLLQLFVRYLIEIPVPLLAVSTPIFVGQWFLD